MAVSSVPPTVQYTDDDTKTPTKPWSPNQYRRTATAGVSLLVSESRAMFNELLSWLTLKKRGLLSDSLFRRVLSSLNLTSRTKIEVSTRNLEQQLKLDEHLQQHKLVSLRYGFDVMAKLCSTAFLLVPAHLLDFNHGAVPNRNFASFVYFYLVFSMVSGSIVGRWLAPSLNHRLPIKSPEINAIFNVTVYCGEFFFYLFGLLCCGYFVYQRNYIFEFVVQRCCIITLPTSFQRRQMVLLFITMYWFITLSEPLFLCLLLISDMRQPELLPSFGRASFLVLKYICIMFTAVGSCMVSAYTIVIPLTTTYLILVIAKHLKMTLEKQTSRFARRSLSGSNSCEDAPLGSDQYNKELEALLDRRTRAIMSNYGCNSLAMDWPELTSFSTLCPSRSANARARTLSTPVIYLSRERCNHASTKDAADLKHHHEQDHERCQGAHLTTNRQHCILSHEIHSTADGLLFMYKNLVKSMTELKRLISSYESRFGGFHLVLLCINSFNMAQWVTAILADFRFRSAEQQQRQQVSDPLPDENYGIWFNARITIRVLSFVVSNSYIFLRCDCLSEQIIKMHAQLFRMNVDLARSALNWSRAVSELPQLEPCQPKLNYQTRQRKSSSIGFEAYNMHQTMASGTVGLTLCELDQIWLLFDQIVRLSKFANFRLASGTYYNKRCLLMIFGQSVSLILLCIQLIDMYTQV